MQLSLYHDRPPSESIFDDLSKQNLIQRIQALDSKARRKGLAALDPSLNPLIGLGMEIDDAGRVTKNSYGVLHLSWLAQQHPEWPAKVGAQLDKIREAIRKTHGVPLQFVIWAGMGGSAEDKSAYLACGLLNKGPKLYVLDSTDPAKLKAILEDIVHRSKVSLPEALKRTLIAGMALGMTSNEPVVNFTRLRGLYDKHKLDSRPNFIYLTMTGSLLDQFAGSRGFRRVDVQLDGGNTTAGRHSSPLTCGSLLPLGLAGVDLKDWMKATVLSADDTRVALRLAAFLHTQGITGRDQVTLLLPKAWLGAEIWTKQNFEESLGKSEEIGLKIIVGEKIKLANCRSPKDPGQRRVFLAVARKGDEDDVADKASLLRRAGYPVAVLIFTRGTLLSRYMQFMHYIVLGLAWLRKMNFVTQPGVELYKDITGKIVEEAARTGALEKTSLWELIRNGPRQAKFPGGITLCYNQLPVDPAPDAKTAPEIYSSLCCQLIAAGKIDYGELTFFGDTRYSARGRSVRKVLDDAAGRLFRAHWKMPADVYEGPAMNHSYHEMIIGHGRCFSTVLLSEKQERLPETDRTLSYHTAQFLATQSALAQRGRAVVAILLRDLEEHTQRGLETFFREALRHAKKL